jgi:hypothetical protein
MRFSPRPENLPVQDRGYVTSGLGWPICDMLRQPIEPEVTPTARNDYARVSTFRSPLRDFANVTLTPHAGGSTKEA